MENKRGKMITAVIVIALFVFTAVAERVAPPSWNMLFMVLKKGSIYALIAVSMNLLNGFTGLFSLGQAGFMLLGAYTYGIFTIPVEDRASVYQYFDGGLIQFALPVPIALILAGLVAAFFAWLIGLPVLRLKSDYLAIATLGFAEIIRAIFQWQTLGPITNGSNLLRKFPVFQSTFAYFAVVGISVAIILLLINSSYGRAFKAIREDEVAAEAMGIDLAKHKMLAFCISSFFAGIGGALLAMYQTSAQAAIFKSAMTYEILLIVVIGGIGSISGSLIASFLYIACSEWWLRFLDQETILNPAERGKFIGIMAVIFVVLLVLMIIRIRKPKENRPKALYGTGAAVCVVVLGWLAYFAATGQTKVPLLRNGFRMVIFSIIIMIVVLFFSRGIMGTRELPDLFKEKPGKSGEVAK
ncbi:MAG: branched-chain amino acid ABC transporter permease [Lachnospiraceae bacterium]|nr:branched-chain amino acid ABC transporter permease [Lachnospiraceae bacterium]